MNLHRYSIIGSSSQQVQSAGGQNIKETRSTKVVYASLTPEQAAKLAAQGCEVEEITRVNATVSIPVPTVAPPEPVGASPIYGPEQLAESIGIDFFRDLFEPKLYGEGFNVAIIDSGIRETHEQINGRVIYSKNYTSDPMQDAFNHGTAVASIITTIAPLGGILNLKVLDSDGVGTEEEVAFAIDDCISLYQEASVFAPSVINLSLGSVDDGNVNNPLRAICRAAMDAGIWVFCAAGNTGPTPQTVTSPACERYVVAVGSCKFDPFIISDFSGRGPTVEGLTKPDVVLYGEDLSLASSTSDTATIAKTGTSFSVAFASGAVVIYFEGALKQARALRELIPGATPILYYITQVDLVDSYIPVISVKPEGTVAGKDNVYGYGLPYGPLAAQSIGALPGAGLDMGSMLSSVMLIGMMGMMMKSMATIK